MKLGGRRVCQRLTFRLGQRWVRGELSAPYTHAERMLQLLPRISPMIALHEYGSCSVVLIRGQHHVISDARAALKQMLNLS